MDFEKVFDKIPYKRLLNKLICHSVGRKGWKLAKGQETSWLLSKITSGTSVRASFIHYFHQWCSSGSVHCNHQVWWWYQFLFNSHQMPHWQEKSPRTSWMWKKNTQDYVDKGKILYLVMPTWCSVTKRPQTLVTNNSLNSQIDNMAQQAKKPTKWWASSGRPPRTWQKLSFCHHKVLLNLHLDSCVYLWNDVWRRTFNLRMCREG